MLPDHSLFQRILWRFSPEEPIEVYELTTVAFGVKSSPFLAIRTLHELVHWEGHKYPLASKAILENFYVDDIACSVENEETALSLYHQLLEILKSGGFDLVKWSSNSTKFLDAIPEDIRLLKSVDMDKDSSFMKVLGFQWDTIEDFFTFKELWSLKIGWDDEVPDQLHKVWNTLVLGLNLLENFKIPRFVGITNALSCSLIGFSDASIKGYGAILYIQVQEELCAALCLANLIDIVIKYFSTRVKFNKIIAMSDSSVTLHWLSSPPAKWKPFVANRVAHIQELLPPSHWYHVPGEDNPAEYLSRGLTPSALVSNSVWLYGFPWLSLPSHQWPVHSLLDLPTPDDTPEARSVTLATTNSTMQNIESPSTNGILELINRVSSYNKLLRTMVYVLRFFKLIPRSSTITASDLNTAEIKLIKVIQSLHFKEDIKLLAAGKSSTSKIRKQSIFR
ncbi:hypothetical protein O3M35_012053 [Rhynocoris fuscipes]|uniref:Reverse transcriptase domain-containing protein n=1 Tax=Rhynocoris fuscipes TaxID=488301 RepID=A0AAW1CS51_9HEMI